MGATGEHGHHLPEATGRVWGPSSWLFLEAPRAPAGLREFLHPSAAPQCSRGKRWAVACAPQHLPRPLTEVFTTGHPTHPDFAPPCSERPAPSAQGLCTGWTSASPVLG